MARPSAMATSSPFKLMDTAPSSTCFSRGLICIDMPSLALGLQAWWYVANHEHGRTFAAKKRPQVIKAAVQPTP
eukprot:906489-Pelagomonas_calceolata.AAC.1